jgi:hypothetical protein
MKRMPSLAPVLVLALAFWAFAAFCAAPSLWSGCVLFLALYVAPAFLTRLLDLFRPLNEGAFEVDSVAAFAWETARRLQAFYDALPFLEAILRLIPGAYSVWLRLWGSRIGFGVAWPIELSVADRSLLQIGNRVVVGQRTCLSGHKLTVRDGRPLMVVRRVDVRDRAILEPGVILEAGAHVAKGAIVPSGTVVAMSETFEAHREPVKAPF